jgi:WD40 repeat protein
MVVVRLLQELVSASYDDTIKVWGDSEDDDEWVCKQTLKGHSSTVWGITFHPGDPTRFASCSDDLTVKIWQAGAMGADGFCPYSNVATLAGYHTRVVFAVDWATSGYLASCGADDAIIIYREEASTDPALPHTPSYCGTLAVCDLMHVQLLVVWNALQFCSITHRCVSSSVMFRHAYHTCSGGQA